MKPAFAIFKMPRNCHQCPFWHHLHCYNSLDGNTYYDWCNYSDRGIIRKEIDNKPIWCKLKKWYGEYEK